MLINSKNINIYNCKCIRFKPSTSNYSFNGTFVSSNTNTGQTQENTRSIDAIFIFTGTKDTILRNISRFIEEIKESIIESCSFFYQVIFEGEANLEVLTNNSVKLPLKLTLIDLYEGDKSLSITANKSINISSPKPCTARVELRANTNVISYTFKINDNEITVKNIKGNETVYIGSGKVTAGGKSKINDVEMWEFPVLKPGTNNISVNRSDVNLTIKYNERW